MEANRSSPREGAESPASDTDAAIQNVVDTMIADTEAYLRRFQAATRAAAPSPPSAPYSHVRSHSGSSTSSQHIVNRGFARQSSVTTNLSWSTSPEYRPVLMNDDAISPASDQESFTLVQSSSESEHEPVVQPIPPTLSLADDLIRLATPHLPPRLDTPPTLSSRYDSPITSTEREYLPFEVSPEDDRHQEYSLPPEPRRAESMATLDSAPVPVSDLPSSPDVNLASQASDVALYEGGLAEASRRLDAFRASGQEYMTLRPDVSTEPQPLGTVTHVRGASEGQSLITQGVRRKPLAPGAKTLEFNHDFTNEIFFVFIICMAQVLTWAGFAQTLVPARELSVSFPKHERADGYLTWYTSAYALGIGAFMMFGHRLGSIFGHQKVFVFGYLWFALWSLLAGLSVYVRVSDGACTAYFCICRGLQGIGPALLIPNGQVLLQRAYPPGPRKITVMALFDGATPLGFVVGSAMASLFAHLRWWSWAYYSLGAVCIAMTALSMLVIPPRNMVVHDLEGGIWHRLDILNVSVGIAGLVLFSAGWNQAPVNSFRNAEAYVLLGSGLFLIAVFIYLESSASSHPLIPFKRMEATTAIALGCTAATWAAFGIWLWYLIQVIEVLRGWVPLRLSAGLVPLLLVGLITAVVGSRLMHLRLAPYWALAISSTTVLISSILMTTAPAKQLYWQNAFFSILIMPIGMVLSISATVGVLGRSLPQGYQGPAGSLAGTAAAYSLSISLGMAGIVERDMLNKGASSLKGYRAAQYLGLGLGGLSFLLALVLLMMAFLRRWNASK